MNGTESSPVVVGLQARAATGMVALAVAVAALVHFGIDERGLISAAVGAVLVVLAGFDLEQRRIPNRIVLPAIAAILVAQLALFPGEALEWLLAGLGAGLVLFLPTLFKADAVGMGDVKLGVLLGVGLGDDVVAALFFGSLAAVPVALWILFSRGASARHEKIPLAPFLALGGVVALFAGELPGG